MGHSYDNTDQALRQVLLVVTVDAEGNPCAG